jgi:hypothetical protein
MFSPHTMEHVTMQNIAYVNSLNCGIISQCTHIPKHIIHLKNFFGVSSSFILESYRVNHFPR